MARRAILWRLPECCLAGRTRITWRKCCLALRDEVPFESTLTPVRPMLIPRLRKSVPESSSAAARWPGVWLQVRHRGWWFSSLQLVAVLLAAVPAWGQLPVADLVLRRGVVLTCDADDRQVESIALRDGRILALGADADIAPLVGPETRTIELAGRTVVPGFIESHGHFLFLGRLRMDLDLSRARSWDEIVRMVGEKAKSAAPGEWIVGRGWHQEKWTSNDPASLRADGAAPLRYPHHAALSAISPNHPVLLIHGTGHATIANAAAMREAGITRESTNPPGGEIYRDAEGNPTGVFSETAGAAIDRAYARWHDRFTPQQLAAERRRAFDLATAECLSKGVTTFQDAGTALADAQFFHELGEAGDLQIRLWLMLRAGPDQLALRLAELRTIDAFDGRLTIRAIKCMADGAIGSHGALLLEPFADKPDSTGLRIQPLVDIRRTALLALEHDYQLCTHAIGDRANREVLDLYAEVFRSRGPFDHRWRIEHAQHLHPEEILRFAELGVIASMQANHATSDGPFVVTRLGVERARRGAYAWRSLLDAGACIANGTDAPVEDVDPLLCFQAAVTRRMANGEAFFPEQCMSRVEALRSYTIDAAFAAFCEQDRGSLEPGKRADLVVLSENPLTVQEADFGSLHVTQTVLGGRVVYERH